MIQGETPGGTATIDRSAAQETTYSYDELGNLVQTTFPDPDGTGPLASPTTSTGYDALGRKASETNQMGQTRTFAYDANGRLSSVALPAVPDPLNAGASTHPTYQYGYDAFGRQTLIRDPYGRQTQFTFDERGNQLSRTLPLGVEHGGFAETFQYDDLDRQTLHVSFEGAVTQSVYDAKTGRLGEKLFFDNLTDYNNGAGTPSQTWTYKYDAFDRVVSVTQSGGANAGTTTTTYDANGRVASIASPQGVINYEYDSATGLKKRTYTTDPNNPLTVLDDTHYAYDVLGRLQTVTLVEQNGTAVSPAQTTTDKYDLVGNLREQDDPNGSMVDYLYDQLDRLDQEVQYAPGGTTKIAEYGYTLEADGKRTAATETIWWNVGGANTPHGNNLTWTYDADGRLIDEALASYDPTLSYTDAFTLDLVGNQRSETKNWTNKPHETITSAFDDDDRLLNSTDAPAGGAATTTTYGYGAGNAGTQETGETVVTGGVTTRSETLGYDLQGRLSVVTTQTFNPTTGRMTSNQQTTYGYDSSGNRTSALLETDTNLDGTYDTSVLTEFLIDPQNLTGYSQVLQQTTTDQKTGQIQQVVVYTIGATLISQTTTPYSSGVAGSPQTLVFGYDGHGSVRVLLDMTAAIATVGGIQQLFHYDAYGNLLNIAASQAATNILYSGQMLDPITGLYDNRARWYDPQTGRFTEIDPFFGDLQDPQSLHRYLYAGANPIGSIDPTGMFFFDVGGFLTQAYLGVKFASAALNIYSGVSDFVNGIEALESGDTLGAAISFTLGTTNFAFAAIDLFGGTPPPGATVGLAVASGRTVARYQKLIIEAPGLARWLYEVMVPLLGRTAWGALGIMAANGFQPVRSGTDAVRNSSGVAHGGENLSSVESGQQWIQEGMGLVPRQVADQLRGKTFANWRAFREAFWRAVYGVPELRSQFETASQLEMQAGRAPFAPKKFQSPGRIKFEIDHMERIDISWERVLYDLDNLMVVAPGPHSAL